MELCTSCYGHGFCRRLTARLLSDDEMDSSEFIRDLRSHAFRMQIPEDSWKAFLIDAYRDYPGSIFAPVVTDQDATEVHLDTAVFDGHAIRYWFRDFCCTPCPPHVMPRVRVEARERVRVLGTILRAIDPYGAGLWGVRGANDEAMPLRPNPLSRPADGCPYPRLLYNRESSRRQNHQGR